MVANFKKMKNTRIALYKIFRKMGISRDELSSNTNLNTDLCFDNNDMNIFLFFLETRFQIDVADKDIMKLQTIDNTVNYIDNKIRIQ